jgi:phospholipase/carboxylesterase
MTAYRQLDTESEVTLEPAVAAQATLILLHGLGADGWDFVPIADELRSPNLPAIRWIFPHAPMRPVTVNAGYVMRAWYDIKAFTPEGRADSAGLAESVERLHDYLRAETERGVPTSRTVVAGFSQGGAVALTGALSWPEQLAGILAMSTYLPFPERVSAERPVAGPRPPVLMCHGRRDGVVPVEMGLEARDALQGMGYAVDWHEYPMEHEVCAAELSEIRRWLIRVLG